MDEQQLQQQIIQLVQAAMSGDQKANQQIQQIMQAAQNGDQQAAQLAQMIQTVAQQMKQSAKFGAKLNYIKYLRGQCPDGYEMKYFKAGGKVCKKCMKKQNGGDVEQVPNEDPLERYKCGKKMKKKACGGKVKEDKCGDKIKAACGAKALIDKCGGKSKKVKK